MRRWLMVLALVSGFAVTDVSAASDNEIIRDVFYSFSNGEQRLIRTMTAYEPTSEEFQDGLQAVIDAKGDPERFESEKNRFRLLWRGRVDDWSQRYEAKDPAILGSMSKISTPSREEFAAAAPWMDKIDTASFGGGIYDGVIGKMNPYEAAYAIAGLQGLSPAKAAESEKKLQDNSGYPTRLVAGFILDDTRKKFKGDLSDVRTAYQADKPTVLAQLRGIEATLQLVKNRVDPVDLAEAGAAFDGAGRKTDSEQVVVAAQDQAVPSLGEIKEVETTPLEQELAGLGPKEGTLVASNKSAGALQPARPRRTLPAFEMPPPKTDDEAFQSRKGSTGVGAVIKEFLKKPAVAMGVGALLGGLLGFLFGGPIGAAIGIALGAASGRVLSEKLQDD